MSDFRQCVRARATRVKTTAPALLGVCVIASALLLAACSRGGAAVDPQSAPAMPVKVQRIDAREIGDSSEYVATIKSRNSATIMSDVEGWIFDIRVKSGDLVKKGQTLKIGRASCRERV